MVVKINENNYNCPFCGNNLESRYSKCFNIYCQGQKFNEGNLIIYRLNPNFEIGRIIKRLEIPASKSLDNEDTYLITKYKVLFKNTIIKTIHPIDLIHYIFDVNEQILTKKGVGVVNTQDFLTKDGKISYEILFPNGKLEQINETEIISKYEPSAKRIISKHKTDPPKNFLIKYWANLFYSYYTSYQIKCITNSRLALMPHQINVAHRLSEEYFPRVILADEVGLGKTIEAGIYIKEMMARNLAERILIIVPATLIRQWQFELENKFNIKFTIYDGKKIKELKRGGHGLLELLQNPFYYDNLIICSLQFARNPKYIELLSQISWDIIIFDEAHHLRRYLTNAATGSYRETLNFKLARKLSQSTESLLLLTATPLQLHSFELFSLIDLIHPEAFDNFSDFEHFRKNMPFINLLISNINDIDKLNMFEIKNTIKLLRDLKYVNKKETNEQILEKIKNLNFKTKLLEKIEADHTISKFLIRNRKKNVFSKEFLNKRIVKTIMVYPTKQELEVYIEIRNYLAKVYNASISEGNIGIGFVITTLQKLLTSSKYAILKSIERRLEHINRLKDISIELEFIKEDDPEYYEAVYEEQYIDAESDEIFNDLLRQDKNKRVLDLINQEKILKEFYVKLKNVPYDSKSDKFIELLSQVYGQNSHEKVIVFTQFVDTLFHLKDLLENQNNNYVIEVFYGGMNKIEKDEAVERFRTNSKFSILISTEIGGEGRNFQFCRILVNYDLPWNPMKLEQRIGRLDRIGQESQEIYIYNFFMEGTIETDILFALDKRINLFEESIGLLEPILGKIEKDFKELIFSQETQKRKKLNEFNRTLDEEIQKAKEIEMQLDDLLIDKKSFQMDGLITSLASCEEVKLSHSELFLLITYFFNLEHHIYGHLEILDHEENEDRGKLPLVKIILYDTLLSNPYYQFSKAYVGTFNLELAREREEIEFFALGHPLIDYLLEYCRGYSLRGTITVLNLKRKELS
ncbi:MAG: DEAD/DEAH box helicase [Promethearchaeota archaeon]